MQMIDVQITKMRRLNLSGSLGKILEAAPTEIHLSQGRGSSRNGSGEDVGITGLANLLRRVWVPGKKEEKMIDVVVIGGHARDETYVSGDNPKLMKIGDLKYEM
ncbi:unnamed protein product [Fusarium graminearum]|nr:unnamed protein product [Fusarium graminearum]